MRAPLPPQERQSPEPVSPWWGETRSRYHFAARYVIGRVVLDLACGTGSGCQILSDAGAAVVYGGDLSWDAVFQARKNCRDGLFFQSDAIRLSIKTGSVQVVTSFETIEHISGDEDFAAEIRRVVHPEGLAIFSTPNALRSRFVDGRPANPFHVREYEPDHFVKLLSSHFSSVELLGQVVSSHFPVCPFWQSREVLPRDLMGRAQVVNWKVQNRFPFRVKDGISRLLHNRPFYPGEYDFTFSCDSVEKAHVLVALCRP